mmetsp:Transcript_25697/g.22808  ORF Transcript_25697/g.22808 Transcript_25697/m.22808 type:complete len:93 (+) Transcript_25697:656-934(+)
MVVYFSLMISWAYFRFVCFIGIIISWSFTGRLSADNNVMLCSYNSLLLCTLLCLNIYWFILLGKMGFGFIVHDKKEDLQQVINLKVKKDQST